MPTLLAIFAHPDDESSCSGTLAMAAARGWRVVLVSATKGEAGEISDPDLATPETISMVREKELIAACGVLGIDDVRFLGYCDSGMAGSIENDLNTSFINADPDTVTRQIIKIIREVRPELMITFEPFGGYGHPDHITISRHTTRAYDLAGDLNTYPDLGPSWQPTRLYYCAFPITWFKRIQNRLKVLGLVSAGFAQFSNQVIENSEKVETQITHEIDVSGFLETKAASLACHRTQLTPHAPFYHMLKPEMWEVVEHEFYIQARPQEPGTDFFGI